ncbi:hypothetical protein P261_02890 [Lachnospiraceae bacterium TWA4]|nr:hypothetical protein P261_02890 [Lachnospiraceae bacterium TWA4]
MPFGTPPPMFSTTSRRVVPIGISTKPTLLIFPPSANTLVPFERSVPIPANQSAPFKIICGIFAHVSTLLRMVGCPNKPFTAGNGGRGRGSPRLPSIEVISAVSSPHTNAPAPKRKSISKSNPVPKMSFPKKPISLACFNAIFKRSTAIGYSART